MRAAKTLLEDEQKNTKDYKRILKSVIAVVVRKPLASSLKTCVYWRVSSDYFSLITFF